MTSSFVTFNYFFFNINIRRFHILNMHKSFKFLYLILILLSLVNFSLNSNSEQNSEEDEYESIVIDIEENVDSAYILEKRYFI